MDFTVDYQFLRYQDENLNLQANSIMPGQSASGYAGWLGSFTGGKG